MGKKEKSKALRQIIILAAILGIVLAATTYLLQPIFSDQYILYFHVAEVAAVIGFFVIQILNSITYRLALLHSEQTAKSMKSLVRIAGEIIVIGFIISYLSQDPVIAASISTIAGLVIGFSASNIISNVIAGMYLAIARPFRIDDRIKVFGEVGIVLAVGTLYTRLALENGYEMLASNSSMVTTTVILKKEVKHDETAQKDAATA